MIRLATVLSLPVLLGGVALAAGPYPLNQCVGTRTPGLGCAANDVTIAQVQVTNGVTQCVAGTNVTLGLRVLLQSNASQRYDIGVFVARDGQPPHLPVAEGGSADCAVFGIPTGPAPLANLNGNACGDITSSSQPASVDLGLVTVPCLPDANGRLKLPATVTWEQNANGTCQAPPAAWLEAGSPAKCNASAGLDVPVTVVGSVTVTKRTAPSGAAGSFAFTAGNAAPASFNLSDGQQRVVTTTVPLTAAATPVTITEAALGGFDPAAQIACTGADGGPFPFATVDPTNRTVTLALSASNSRAACTFTNTAASFIRLVKNALGGDDTFDFDLAQSAATITTTGGTGQFLSAPLPPGRYDVTEIVPPGWSLTTLTCADPTGGTVVDLAGKRARVDLAPGETVTCTFTNQRGGSGAGTGIVNIVKNTVGGDAAFGFLTSLGGGAPFALATTGGASPPKTFTNVIPGTYTVTEQVPPGWQAPTITCTDPTGNSTGSGTIATINVGGDETVTCTFTNRAFARVVVEKVALGGDDTFPFSGLSLFSIATTGGYGRDDTTFAAVPGGTVVNFSEAVPAGWTFSGARCVDDATGARVGQTFPNGQAVTPTAGQRITCTVTNTRQASLTIVEISLPNSPQAFDYATSGTGLAPFTLADNAGGGASRVFTNLAPGAGYTVTQGDVPGWRLARILCTDRFSPVAGDRSTVDVPGRTLTANLQPGEQLVCVFLNVQVSNGTIAVTKRAEGGNDTFAFANSGGTAGSPTNPSAFTLATVSGSASRSLTGLAVGTYVIAEGAAPAGWLSPPTVNCSMVAGSSTTIVPVPGGVAVTLGQTAGQVDSVACTWENVRAARVTIVEDAVPDSPQSFAYAATGAGVPASFSLVNDGAPAPADRASFGGLAAGAYGFTVTNPAGWRLLSIACTGAQAVTDLAQRRATVALAPGSDATCTFRHAREATLSVTKTAPAATAADAFPFEAPTGLDGSYAAGQTRSVTILPGAYTVKELAPAGWTIANIACTGGTVTYTGATVAPTPAFEAGDDTANILVAAGDVVACTFTNAPAGAAILVRKTSVGGGGVFAFTGAQDFQINTLARTLPIKVLDLPAGTHVVREIVPAGWRLTGLTCTGNSTTSLATATATVTLAAGERVSCEFTDEKLGRIEIVKALRGESTTAFSFSVPAALDPAQGFTLTPPLDPGTATRVFENVPPGDYLVTENGPPNGWRLTSIACQDPTGNTATNPADGGAFIRLAAGETVRCTWTNATNATIVIGAVSFFGTDRFGFSTTNFPTFTSAVLDTTPVTGEVAAGRQVAQNLPPATYGIVAQPAPAGWSFLGALCASTSGEQRWTIAGPTVTINLPDGETVRCFFFYAPSDTIAPGGIVPVPALSPPMLLLLAGLMAVTGLLARRRRPAR